MQRRGARLVATNVRAGPGELDLLVALSGRLVAVEVKTRVGVDPEIQFTEMKRRRVRDAAMAHRPRPDRIDLITVRLDGRGATIRWYRAVA